MQTLNRSTFLLLEPEIPQQPNISEFSNFLDKHRSSDHLLCAKISLRIHQKHSANSSSTLTTRFSSQPACVDFALFSNDFEQSWKASKFSEIVESGSNSLNWVKNSANKRLSQYSRATWFPANFCHSHCSTLFLHIFFCVCVCTSQPSASPAVVTI